MPGREVARTHVSQPCLTCGEYLNGFCTFVDNTDIGMQIQLNVLAMNSMGVSR